MSLKIPRRQYNVCVLDSRTDRAQPTIEMLRQAEYEPQHFSNMDQLRAALAVKPPHVILFHRSDDQINVNEALVEMRQRLPESHFLVLSSAAGLAATWREWGHLIFDCVLTPPVHPRQMIQAVERAAERDAYMYRSEELAEKLAAAEALADAPHAAIPVAAPPGLEKPTAARATIPALPKIPDDDIVAQSLEGSIANLRHETQEFLSAVWGEVSHVHNAKQSGVFFANGNANAALPVPPEAKNGFEFGKIWSNLVSATQLDDVVRETLTHLAEQTETAPAVYLRHLPNRRCLVTSAAYRLPAESWKSLGLHLNEEPNFCLSDLRHPEKLSGLKEMGQTLVGHDEIWVKPLILRDEVHGIFVVFAPLAELPVKNLEAIVQVCSQRAQLLDLQQYLHTIEMNDPSTLVLNKATMQARLSGEIARSRRLESPVSLLTISLDQYRDLLTHYGLEEAQMAVRALAKIIEPRSRANDTIGRLSAEELGLILPHTSCEGAAIKAERLRKLIAAADFNRLFPNFPKLTVSIGVSEYPSCSRDSDDLFNTADDALWQVKNKVSNKVCVATPMAGFVPDFKVLST